MFRTLLLSTVILFLPVTLQTMSIGCSPAGNADECEDDDDCDDGEVCDTFEGECERDDRHDAGPGDGDDDDDDPEPEPEPDVDAGD